MVGSKLTPGRLDNYGLVSRNWFPPTPWRGVFFRKSNAKAAKFVTCLILRFGGLRTKLIGVGQGPGMEVLYRVFCGFGFEPSFIDYPAFVSQLRQHRLNTAYVFFFSSSSFMTVIKESLLRAYCSLSTYCYKKFHQDILF